MNEPYVKAVARMIPRVVAPASDCGVIESLSEPGCQYIVAPITSDSKPYKQTCR